MVFDDDECETFFLLPPGNAPTITLQGNVVRVEVDHLDVIDCASPASTYTVAIPALSQGSYTIELVARAFGNPGIEVSLETAGIVVGPAAPTAPTSIPASNAMTLAMLAAMLVAAVWMRRRDP